jgi:hypothetical protein
MLLVDVGEEALGLFLRFMPFGRSAAFTTAVWPVCITRCSKSTAALRMKPTRFTIGLMNQSID